MCRRGLRDTFSRRGWLEDGARPGDSSPSLPPHTQPTDNKPHRWTPFAAREPHHHALTSVRASGSVTSESHSSRRCSRPLVVSFKTNHWREIRREREAQGKASEVLLTLWVPNRSFREKVNQLRQGGVWTRRTRRCGHRKAEAFHCGMEKALLPRPSCPPLSCDCPLLKVPGLWAFPGKLLPTQAPVGALDPSVPCPALEMGTCGSAQRGHFIGAAGLKRPASAVHGAGSQAPTLPRPPLCSS